MSRMLPILALAAWCFASQAHAGCESSTRVTGTAFTALLGQGALICGRRATGSPATDRWQEEHRASGELWDYKKGPTDRVDPSKKMGSWSLSADTVTHTYDPGGPALTFVWTVHAIASRPGEYSFCTGDRAGVEIVRAIITTGSGPCSSFPP